MSTDKMFKFLITPQPRDPLVSVSQGNFVDITFTVQNTSGRRVRVEALVNALQGPPGPDGTLQPAFAWEQLLKIQEAPEWDFEVGGTRVFTVRVTVPEYLARGTYRFRLVLNGVEDPDHDYFASDPVSFTVVGKPQDIRPFVLGGLLVLAAIIVLAVLAVILMRPRPQLRVTLQAPPVAVVGVSTAYTITVQNARPVSATNVIVEYRLPAGMAAATAYISDARLRYCDETEELIRCDLGTLGPDQTTSIRVEGVAGPGATVITNTNTVSTTVALQQKPIQADVSQKTTSVAVDVKHHPYSLVLDVDASTAQVEEPLEVRLLAWRNAITLTQPVSYTFFYTLPVGVRYQDLPTNCSQVNSDYFKLRCMSQVRGPRGDLDAPPLEVRFTLVPLELASQQNHQASLWVASAAAVPSAQISPTLAIPALAHAGEASRQVSVVDNSLYFDGQDDFVELGFARAPKTFTAEMWVQPDSTADAQAIIGAHRQLEDTVQNMFLVGYYNGSLDVNVGGKNYTLAVDKTTHRFHLAVVVEGQGDSSRVTVYVNGDEQPWRPVEGEEDTCPGCKIFPTVLDDGETLPWVLGQDWDPFGSSKRTSDYFSGSLSEVRLWKTARSREQIRQGMALRPRSDDRDLLAYWRLDPVSPLSDVIADQVSAENNGRRIQAEWGEPAPRFGTALQFDGWDDALVSDDLRLTEMKAEDGKVAVTLAAWIYVDAVPSTEQWVLGSAAPTGGTLGLPTGSELLATAPLQETQVAQTRAQSAQLQLASAMQAVQALEMSPAEAALAERIAQLHLLRALSPLLDADFPSSVEFRDVITGTASFAELDDVSFARDIKEYSALAVMTDTLQVANPAAEIVANLETLLELEAERNRLETDGENAALLNFTSSVPEDPAAALSGADREEIDIEKIRLLQIDERARQYENTVSLIEGARQIGQEKLLVDSLTGIADIDAISNTLSTSKGYVALYTTLNNFLPYQVSLALAQLSWNERQLVGIPEDDAGLERLQAVEALEQAQTGLDASLAELITWLKGELDEALAEQTVSNPASGRVYDDADVRILATAAYVADLLEKARINLEKAEQAQLQLAEAQQAADQAQAEALQTEALAQEVEKDAAERQALEEQVAASEQRLRTARTPAERAAAQADLDSARSRLEDARARLYISLQNGVQSLQQRETVLQDLEPRLMNAADRAVEAAMASARRYNVERWVGPWLDFILGTRTPVKSASETIRPLALLAAQQVLKAEVDAQVDIAQKDLKQALEEQDRLVNSSGRARLRQQIITDINTYLESLNKDVASAQQKLNEALAEQQGNQGESKVPLVLAEALAQTVADRVTQTAVRQLPLANLRALLSSNAALQQSIKDQVRSEMRSALESARRPVRVRLYYDTYYTILRLNYELNAGIEDQTELALKTELRNRLAELNLALLRVLNAQSVLLKPGIGFQQLINQVADESGRAASLDALLAELQKALDNTDSALTAYLRFSQFSALGFSLPGRSTGTADGRSSDETPSAGVADQGTLAAQPVVLQALDQPESGTAEGETASEGGQENAAVGGEQGEAITGTLAASPLNIWLGLAIDQDGHAILAAKSRSAPDWTVVKDDRPLLTRQWVHYTVTVIYDAATGTIQTAKLYRNGELVKGKGKDPRQAVELGFGTLRCADGFYIGGLCDLENNMYYFFGGIDDVRVWNRSLTDKDLDNWRKMPGVTFDEYAYWPFDDGPGSARPVSCDSDATCDISELHRFPLTVYGPAWVETGRTSASPTGASR